MYQIVLIRHGESLWNKENRFTGWQDIDLSEAGVSEAKKAGIALRKEGFSFDCAYTSVLKRALRTCWIVLDEMDLLWIPVSKNWRLNERHYGALQGLNKSETAEKHGEEQVKIWRRSYDTPPPPMDSSDPRHPSHDPRYKNVPRKDLPNCESLKDTVARFLPFWNDEVAPEIRKGQKIVLVAHGNSLRALVQHLEHLSQAEIMELNLPTGIPLVYNLDKNLEVISKRFVGDADEVAKAMEMVANQGKVKKMSTLIRGIGELLTLEGANKKSGRRVKEDDLGVIPKAALLIDQGRILWAGPEAKLKEALKNFPIKQKKITKEWDVKGQTVLPGWIDCHTHLVYGGDRWEEFELRCQGASYQEIAMRGGGILSTMKATRAITKKALQKISQKRVDEFLRQGVTTLEIKSGYGLDLEGETKQLEVALSLKGPQIITTFLGAHAKPPEFETTSEYLIYLNNVVLPLIKKKKLASRVDIFVEKNFFEGEIAKKYLSRAKELGFDVVIHADQLSLSGGTQLAVELGASSADHVIKLGPSEVRNISQSETVAVLLPLADLYMKCDYPPARTLIDEGACVALATDYNPGSCPSHDITLVGLLARLQMKMTLPEIISAWTIGGARALRLKKVGSLQKGFRADFQVVDQNWRGLFYQAGKSHVTQVFVEGKSFVV